MSFPPDICLIGAQRSGTTALAQLLDQHPDVTVAHPKEPAFHTIHQTRGLEWYRTCFPGPESSIFIDATTWYSVGPTDLFPASRGELPSDTSYLGVPQRIHALNPATRFIYMLREPAERAYSAYWYYRDERRSASQFRAAIDRDPFYLRGSDYVGQLNNYLEFFERDAFLLLVFEDFVADPQSVVSRCLDFMGVPHERWVPDLATTQRNELVRRSWLGSLVEQLFPIPDAVRSARRFAHARGAKAMADWLLTRGIPSMKSSDRRHVHQLLEPRRTELETVLGTWPEKWV